MSVYKWSKVFTYMRRDKAAPMSDNLESELVTRLDCRLEEKKCLSNFFAKLWYCLLLWNKGVKNLLPLFALNNDGYSQLLKRFK